MSKAQTDSSELAPWEGDEANLPQMVAPTEELIRLAYDAVENANVPPEVGDPSVTAKAIQRRIREGSFDESLDPAESLPALGDSFPDVELVFCSFHLRPSSFEIQEGPNRGKKGVYAVVEVMTLDGELQTVQTGAQNVLTQLVKAWEESRFPFRAVLEVKPTGTAGRTTQWLRRPGTGN